jgi:hypothetical protein
MQELVRAPDVGEGGVDGRSAPSRAGYRVHQHEVERCESLSVSGCTEHSDEHDSKHGATSGREQVMRHEQASEHDRQRDPDSSEDTGTRCEWREERALDDKEERNEERSEHGVTSTILSWYHLNLFGNVHAIRSSPYKTTLYFFNRISARAQNGMIYGLRCQPGWGFEHNLDRR